MRLEPNTSKSRADDLRARRTQSSSQRRVTSPNYNTYRATAAVPMPSRPVAVRNTTFVVPMQRQAAAQQPRRKYYVATGAPGTELRLPALPVFHPGWRLLSGFIAAIMLFGIFSVLYSPFFKVGNIVVKGNHRLETTELQAAMKLEDLSIIEVNPSDIQAVITQTFPDVDRVSVSVGLPTDVTVSLHERKPVVAWQWGEKTRWADAEGVLFQPRGDAGQILVIHANDAPPLVQQIIKTDENTAAGTKSAKAAKSDAPSEKTAAPAGPEKMDMSLVQTAEKLATRLPQGTTMVYSKSDGLGWKDQDHGWDVFIGSDLGSFEEKFTMYQSISAQLVEKGLKPALISVEFADAPYYRLEQ